MMYTVIFAIFPIFLLPLITSTYGRTLTDCDIKNELLRANVKPDMISNWVCLVLSESGGNTNLISGPFTASSYSYGLFQINSAKFCVRGRTGGLCRARCEDFVNDDVQDDIMCAKKVYNMNGFKAWKGWSKKCKNKPLPDLSHCQ